ncbi:hypothetical protein AB7W30_22675 [Providencia manganoxydans]|uniref:hypothetical protein n=1 Tax=Providencia manganoxydans TaxID=2923283 RepID=UPI0032DA3A20
MKWAHNPQMDHYIIRGGRFQTAVYDLLKRGFSISWYDKWGVELYAPTKINKTIFDDWLRITDPSDKELISKLTKTIHKKRKCSAKYRRSSPR